MARQKKYELSLNS